VPLLPPPLPLLLLPPPLLELLPWLPPEPDPELPEGEPELDDVPDDPELEGAPLLPLPPDDPELDASPPLDAPCPPWPSGLPDVEPEPAQLTTLDAASNPTSVRPFIAIALPSRD